MYIKPADWDDNCRWESCSGGSVARGLCTRHYNRAYKQGRLKEFPALPRRTPEEHAERARQTAKDYYWANIDVSRQKMREKVAVVRAERLAWINEYKVSRGCADCGYNKHPAALAFDHRDPATKSFGIAKRLTCSEERLLAEIAKCDVRCHNCHAIRSVAEGHLGRPRMDAKSA